VFIVGTFNGWERKIPMHRSGNDFSYIHNVTRDKHAYKFIVDDVWRHAPDQPTVADPDGKVNNYIDVHDFAPYGMSIGDVDFVY
jgi:5'-AMP-activated protein kinase regulatory beta subunit